MTPSDIWIYRRPSTLTDESIKDIDKIAFYVKQAESYMSFLEGMVTGTQEALRMIIKEEA